MSSRRIIDLDKQYVPIGPKFKKVVEGDGNFEGHGEETVIDVINNDYNTFISANHYIDFDAIFNGIEERELLTESSVDVIIHTHNNKLDTFMGDEVALSANVIESKQKTETFIGGENITLFNVSESKQTTDTFISNDTEILISAVQRSNEE